MKINLNDPIEVKLTDLGKEIYFKQFDQLNEEMGRIVIEARWPKVNSKGRTRMALWEFIQLYGPYIGMAKPNVIEPLDIHFKVGKEKTNA